jgi:transmembrane sensor
LAAALVWLGVLAWHFAGVPSESTPVAAAARQTGPRVYETPIGGGDVVRLADGSVIRLNTATRIEVDMTSARRDVVLLSGEAHFDVAHNDRVPFVVRVGDTRIRAVGTAFSVQKRVHDVEVTVTEGVVQVEQHERASPDAKSGSFSPLLLRAGQVAQVNEPGTTEIREIAPREMARKLLWQQKMLAFDGNTLQEVVDEYSRYTPFTIHIADAETAAIRVGGYFRSDDIAGLLTSLEENFSISVTQTAANSFELKRK